MSRRRGPVSLLTHRPMIPGSDVHLAALAGLSPLGRVLYPDLHHRRVVAAIAAARAKVAQTAENPRDGHPEGSHHPTTHSGGLSGCNAECA